MMYTCELHSNTVVIYDTTYCPMCDIEEKIEELEKELRKQSDTIDDLDYNLNELQNLVKEHNPELLY